MKIAKTFLSAALAMSFPCAALAQTAEPAPAPVATSAPAAAAEPVVEKKKDEPKFVVTPYGFVLAEGFFDGGSFASKDNTWQATRGSNGGTVLMSARGSRLGLKLALKDDNWTGAVLGGVLEYDFKGGFLPTSATVSGTSATISGTGNTPSSSWYNALMRLRIATLTASWKGDWGSLQVLAGQDFGIVSVLNPETIAWTADPLATEAGNLWRRSPQFRLTYGLDLASLLNVSVAAAVLSPSDSTTAVDNGVGNQSRRPDVEVRGQVAVKVDKDLNATVGFGYHNNAKRFNYATVNQKDITVYLWGLDADVNLTQFLQVKGEYFASSGAEDSYTGMYRSGVSSSLVAVNSGYKPLQTSGYWAQAIIKPLSLVWLTGTYGQESVNNTGDLVPFAPNYSSVRTKNAQLGFGLLFNAGKYWRFGLEYDRTTSTYFKDSTLSDTIDVVSQQTVVSTQLKF